ncbi:PREDICTED: tRNA methyltransferase 10 homolog A-like, partial [Amphimedon queenslandica]|uniref:tRNA (guanine(9)-N(1))-methyltransferase n=1 Tax=Amphimedon queenslandica TaxID=400682 RepID=A0A1X7STP2_AMPQE
MAEAMDGASIEKRKEIMEKLKSSLPDDLTKTQRKKQAKIMFKKLQMKEKSKLQKKKPKHTKRLTKTMSCSDASKVRVAIELGYSELMTEKDIRMLIKQCQRCYSENRHSVKPLQLYMTSLSGTVKEAMETLEGYDKWDVHFHEKKYLDVFEQKDIVFLAAESPNILTELSDDKVYVIGGLVDHNRYK